MTQADWHPYPEEKPNEDGYYIISYWFCGKRWTGEMKWSKDHWEEDHGLIYAWAELPEPYKPQEESLHPDDITAKKYVENDPETLKALGIFD